MYGSGHVGIFGSIIEETNVEGILKLDLLATDFFHDKAYPSFLYYNPHTKTKTIAVKLDTDKKVDLYDTVSGNFVAKNVSASAKIKITALNSAVIIVVPANAKVSYSGSKMRVNDVVVDYNFQPEK